MIQRSDEWYRARLGKVTASQLFNVFNSGAGRQNYMVQLILEELTGKQSESFQSAAMIRGVELEDSARNVLMLEHDHVIKQVGLIDHPEIKGFAASPDGIADGEFTVEIKCPNSATHLETLMSGKIKKEYILQMHAQMMCCNLKKAIFFSYDDRFPFDLSHKKIIIERDELLVKEIEMKVTEFISEKNRLIEELRKC